MDDLIKYGIMLGGFGLLAYLLLQKQQTQAAKYYYRTDEGNIIVTTEPHPELEPISPEEIPPEAEPAMAMFTSNEECRATAMAMGYDDGGCLWPSEASGWPPEANLGPCLIEGSRHCGNEGQCNCYGWNYVGVPEGESYEPVEPPSEEPEGMVCSGIWNPSPETCAEGDCPSGKICVYVPPRLNFPAYCTCVWGD